MKPRDLSEFSEAFLAACRRLRGIEGGHVDNPFDRGGETNHGITYSVANRHGYTPEEIDWPLALEIYWLDYWDHPVVQLPRIARLDPKLAAGLFDIAVNMGRRTSMRFFQRMLNAFNNRQRLYRDIYVDGINGNKTIKAWSHYRAHRGKQGANVMRYAVNSLQGRRYLRISENDESQEIFTYGWFLRRVLEFV